MVIETLAEIKHGNKLPYCLILTILPRDSKNRCDNNYREYTQEGDKILFTHKRSQATSADPDQTPHNVASDQDLHCLQTGFSIQNSIKATK